jgi:hypothetical protein
VSLNNILLQADIDENVDYDPIFASGHGPLASLIAVAGVLIGNGISYLASRLLYAKAKQKKMYGWSMFFFWVCVMSVGNFLCYVPIRTFATHADMATTAKGLDVSPWMITLVLGIHLRSLYGISSRGFCRMLRYFCSLERCSASESSSCSLRFWYSSSLDAPAYTDTGASLTGSP